MENEPPSSAVPAGKVRVCMVGFPMSHHTGRAHQIAAQLAAKVPNEVETWFYWAKSAEFYAFTEKRFASVPFPDHLKGHGSSPFVWLEEPPKAGGQGNATTPIGGRAEFVAWIQKTYPQLLDADKEFAKLVETGPSISEAFHVKDGAKATAEGADIAWK